MAKRILDIVDMQNDFMMPKGALYVKDAEKIIPHAKAFLQRIGGCAFDFILMKSDTHFAETYSLNPESKQFPMHCRFNTWGWKTAFDLPDGLAIPVYRMNKNAFDMWAAQPDLGSVSFNDETNAQAYKNLFSVLSDKEKPQSRDTFLKEKDIGKGTEVVMVGVASDYCVHDAIAGYLKRGCKVTVLRDMVKGIGTDVEGRAKSGHIDEVVKLEAFRESVKNGQLRVIESAKLLKEINQEKKNEQNNKNCRRPTQPNRR